MITISTGSLLGENCQQKMKRYGLDEKAIRIIVTNKIGQILLDTNCPQLRYFISESLYGEYFKIVFTFIKGTNIAQVHTIIKSSEEEHEEYLSKK